MARPVQRVPPGSVLPVLCLTKGARGRLLAIPHKRLEGRMNQAALGKSGPLPLRQAGAQGRNSRVAYVSPVRGLYYLRGFSTYLLH
jgi:hypothetical protein